MKHLLHPILLLFIALSATAQDCSSPAKYREKMQAADSLIAAGNFSLAYYNHN